jgi:hypothetical protein
MLLWRTARALRPRDRACWAEEVRAIWNTLIMVHHICDEQGPPPSCCVTSPGSTTMYLPSANCQVCTSRTPCSAMPSIIARKLTWARFSEARASSAYSRSRHPAPAPVPVRPSSSQAVWSPKGDIRVASRPGHRPGDELRAHAGGALRTSNALRWAVRGFWSSRYSVFRRRTRRRSSVLRAASAAFAPSAAPR